MKAWFTIGFSAVMLAAVLFATATGLYWLLVSYFGVSPAGALMLIIPAVLLGGLASIYGFYHGIQQIRVQSGQTSNWLDFERAFHINVFGLLLAVPALLSLYFLLVHQDITLTMLFGFIAAAVAMWIIPKLARNWQQREK